MPPPPARHLVVLTCMDARIDPLAILGLQVGDAHVLRNAGGLATDDVLRSLTLSQTMLETREIVVIHHTDCASNGGVDIEPQLRDAVATIRSAESIPHRDDVRGLVYDVETGEIAEP
jgi:carbonic anhydrase